MCVVKYGSHFFIIFINMIYLHRFKIGSLQLLQIPVGLGVKLVLYEWG